LSHRDDRSAKQGKEHREQSIEAVNSTRMCGRGDSHRTSQVWNATTRAVTGA
jgi:hypothetical protein